MTGLLNNITPELVNQCLAIGFTCPFIIFAMFLARLGTHYPSQEQSQNPLFHDGAEEPRGIKNGTFGGTIAPLSRIAPRPKPILTYAETINPQRYCEELWYRRQHEIKEGNDNIHLFNVADAAEKELELKKLELKSIDEEERSIKKEIKELKEKRKYQGLHLTESKRAG